MESHIAEPDGILATYAFNEDVKCSLKGNHLHRQGLVVKTLCEMVLAMERDCGRKSIIGFDGIIRDHDARRRYHTDLRLLSGWLPDAKRRLQDVIRRVKFRTDVLDAIRTELPSLYRELIRRRNSTRGDEVQVTSTQLDRLPKGFGEGAIPRLVGFGILETKVPAQKKLAATLDSYEKLERESPAIDGPSADALRKLASKFDDRFRRLDEWYRETAEFLAEYNLNLALLALGHENAQVIRDGDGWRVSYMWGESALLPRTTFKRQVQ